MKKMALLVCLCMVFSMLAAAAVADEQVTLRYMTLSNSLQWEAEQQMLDLFQKEYPNIKVETTVISGVADFVTALTTKFAANEAPDVFTFQGGSRTFEYAAAGRLMDLKDQAFMDRFNEKDLIQLAYHDGVYAMPMNVEMSGLFVNREALKEYGDIEIPNSYTELLEFFAKLQAAGCKYPLVCAGKDINNVAQIDFQYLSTVLWFNNPDYYLELLQGKRALNNDPDINDMFAKYGELKNYMNPDCLGVDNDEAIKRFIRGDGVVWIAHGSNVATIRNMAGEDFDFVMVPSVLNTNAEDRVINAGLALAMHVTSTTEHVDESLKLLEFYSRPEIAALYATVGKGCLALKGTDIVPDPAYAPMYEFMSAHPERRCGHADLIWIGGIKDVMKEVTQKWFLGDDLQSCLDYWQDQHQMLLRNNPTFTDEFIAKYYAD